jgi:hypothetical protein
VRPEPATQPAAEPAVQPAAEPVAVASGQPALASTLPAATRSLAWGPGEVPGKPSRPDAAGQDHGYWQILLRPLIRAQLGLSLVCLAFALAVTASFPILCAVLPGLSNVTVLGLPLTLVALGIGVFPFILLIGAFYTRQAARLEQQFVTFVNRVDGAPADD